MKPIVSCQCHGWPFYGHDIATKAHGNSWKPMKCPQRPSNVTNAWNALNAWNAISLMAWNVVTVPWRFFSRHCRIAMAAILNTRWCHVRAIWHTIGTAICYGVPWKRKMMYIAQWCPFTVFIVFIVHHCPFVVAPNREYLARSCISYDILSHAHDVTTCYD